MGPASLLLCGCQGRISQRLDLTGTARGLAARRPGLPFLVGEDLCQRPAEVTAWLKRERAPVVVFGACLDRECRSFFQETLRQVGLDPFASPIVDLREGCAYVHEGEGAGEKAGLLLGAALERAALSREVPPACLRPRFGFSGPTPVSRRGLFTLFRTDYEVTPYVEGPRCASWRGCRLCLAACPRGALEVREGGLLLKRDDCDACGRCLPACPVGAIQLPNHTPEQVDAELGGLLGGEGPQPRAIAFTCRHHPPLRALGERRLAYPPAVLPMELPCVAMATPRLILRALELGASGVLLFPCTGPEPVPPARLRRRLRFLRAFLAALSFEGERLALVPLDKSGDLKDLPSFLEDFVNHLQGKGPALKAEGPCTPSAQGNPSLKEVLLRLVQRAGLRPQDMPVLREGEVPFGTLRLDREKCTLCGLCADRCPTGALASPPDDGKVRLLFDHGSCIACGLCARYCPERGQGVLRVERGLDCSRLEGPRELLAEGGLARCRECGQTIAPLALGQRLQEKIQGAAAGLDYLVSLCPACRILAQWPQSGRTRHVVNTPMTG